MREARFAQVVPVPRLHKGQTDGQEREEGGKIEGVSDRAAFWCSDFQCCCATVTSARVLQCYSAAVVQSGVSHLQACRS